MIVIKINEEWSIEKYFDAVVITHHCDQFGWPCPISTWKCTTCSKRVPDFVKLARELY